jgi:hypothetical protein
MADRVKPFLDPLSNMASGTPMGGVFKAGGQALKNVIDKAAEALAGVTSQVGEVGTGAAGRGWMWLRDYIYGKNVGASISSAVR